MSEDATAGLRWRYCLTGPCEWLAIWPGPHRHLLKDDGSIGILLEHVLTVREPDGSIRTVAPGATAGGEPIPGRAQPPEWAW